MNPKISDEQALQMLRAAKPDVRVPVAPGSVDTMLAQIVDTQNPLVEPTTRPALARHRRWLAPLAAASAIAIVIGVVVTVLGISGSRTASVSTDGGLPSPSSPDANAIACQTATTTITTSDLTEPGVHTVQGFTAQRPPCFYWVVYAKGSFDPATVKDATAATVDQDAGLYGRLPALTKAVSANTDGIPSLAWQTAPDKWAVVQGAEASLQTLAVERMYADNVNNPVPSSPSFVPTPDMPYFFGYIPDVAHQQWGCNGETDVGDVSIYYSKSKDGATTLTTQVYGPGASAGTRPTPPVGSTSITVNGHLVSIGTSTIDVDVAPFAFRFAYTGPQATPADLMKIAEHLEFPTDMTNKSTWFSCSNT